MNKGHKVYRTGFADRQFEIDCNNNEAYKIAEFLFLDFPGAAGAKTTKQYDIISSGSVPKLSLWDGEKHLYFGMSRYRLAYILMNEVIYHCINNNDCYHALHAGCVWKDDRCILLPGQSGSGKSSLTSWLLMNGFQYLTDELVFLTVDGVVIPLTRPVSLKVGPGHASWLLENDNGSIVSETGSMVPHRLLNPEFIPRQPKVTDIIFPQFTSDTESRLQAISPAKSSLYLLRSHVNARNLQGHGVQSMSVIVKQCRSFMLSFNGFDSLQQVFHSWPELRA